MHLGHLVEKASLLKVPRQLARDLIVASIAVAALGWAAAADGSTASVTLAWDPSTDANVVAYNLYYGVASQTYTNKVTVGAVTNASITGLVAGATYFFAATASDNLGLESDFSNEVPYYVRPGLTVTAQSASRPYGAANPVLTGTLSGVQSGDNITATYSTTANATSTVGNYAITVALVDPGNKLGNYSVSTNNGTLTVTPAPLSVTAATQSRTYGAANPPLTGTLTGLQNGDAITATFSTAATPASPVGPYSIVPALADPANKLANYTVSATNGTLTISPAALTVTAGNAARVYGAANPAFTASYSGFQNGETLPTSGVTGSPSLTATATATSPVPGPYPITAAAGTLAAANYSFSFANGQLTLAKATTAATLNSSSNPALPGTPVVFTNSLGVVAPGGGTPTGTVNFRIDGSIAGSGTLSGTAATYTNSTLAHGTHTVVAEYGGDGNFLGATNQLSSSQVINTPPVAGAETILRPPTEGAKIPIASLLGIATDADGDPITFLNASATSANGGTVVSNNGWLFYTSASGSTNADSFAYTISDGYATAGGSVTVSVRAVSSPSLNLASADLGNSSYAISGDGIPGRTYSIQYTDTLPSTDWQTLGTATADGSGVIQFLDTAGNPQRQYRSVYP